MYLFVSAPSTSSTSFCYLCCVLSDLECVRICLDERSFRPIKDPKFIKFEGSGSRFENFGLLGSDFGSGFDWTYFRLAL